MYTLGLTLPSHALVEIDHGLLVNRNKTFAGPVEVKRQYHDERKRYRKRQAGCVNTPIAINAKLKTDSEHRDTHSHTMVCGSILNII